jgi:hypothetical protein
MCLNDTMSNGIDAPLRGILDFSGRSVNERVGPALFLSVSTAIADTLFQRAVLPLSRSTYYTSMLTSLTAPSVRFTTRLGDFATNRQE